jgi:hypothetical protein
MPFVCVMMTVVGENDCVVLYCELVFCSRGEKWKRWRSKLEEVKEKIQAGRCSI